MFQHRSFQVGIALSALFFSHFAFSADSTTNIVIPGAATAVGGTSEATVSGYHFIDHLDVNLFSIFHGPSVTHLSSSFSLDRNGYESKIGMNFDSTLSAGYLITKTVGIGLEVPFLYYPGTETHFELGDVGLRIYDRKLIKTNELSVNAGIIFQAITNKYSQLDGQDFAVKINPSFRYLIPASRFSFGAWTQAKAYLGADRNRKAFKLWGAPHLDYQITPKLSAIFQYSYEARHFNGNAGWLNFTTYQTELNPGVAYMITPKVIINPFLQILTTEKIAMDRTGIGAILTASL